MEYIAYIKVWTNNNSGFLGLLLFIITILLGWVTGIFKTLRRKPNLKIKVIPGPSFCASYDTGRVYEGHLTHRTAMSVYLSVTNTGSAPTDIEDIYVGYKSQASKNKFEWFWLKELTVCKSDFMMELGDDLKIFPFFKQKNQSMENIIKTYLNEGESSNGIIYYEQEESWGKFIPTIEDNLMKIKILIKDVYGRKYTQKATIPKVTLNAAQKVCSTFGETRESLVEPGNA